jgi:opacity protein-like surface antigen
MNKLVAVLALSFAGAAWGQTGELWFSFGESLLQDNGIGTLSAFGGTSNDVKLDNGYRFSFRFGFNQGDHFGHEVQYAFNHAQFDVTAPASEAGKSAMHFHQGGYNFLYYLNKDRSRIRPFATAGIMFDDFVAPGGGINSGSQNKFGANFGAGVKFHIKGMWAGRLDVREYLSGKPDFGILGLTSGALWQTEVSAGVGIGF